VGFFLGRNQVGQYRGPRGHTLVSYGGFARVELDIGPGNSSADSPHVNADVCQVVAKEEGGDASRQHQEAC
jgi:hypothetical protein